MPLSASGPAQFAKKQNRVLTSHSKELYNRFQFAI